MRNTTRLRSYRMYVDGKAFDGSGSEELEVVNPATEEVIGRVPQATRADVVRAIESARRAFDDGPWPRLKPMDRSRILLRYAEAIERRRDDLVSLIVAETGATQAVAELAQFDFPLSNLYWWAERAGTFSFMEPLPPSSESFGGQMSQGVLLKEPVGVVAGITPFNFPLFLNIWKTAPALAMGNTVVLRPSPFTPLQALVLGEVFEEIDLPPGVVNIVTGDVECAQELTRHPAVDMVSFTGSDVVGSSVMEQAAGSLKKVLLELGGKSPMILFEGCNLEAAIPTAVMGFTVNAGQACAGTTRILVQRSIYDDVLAAMVAVLGAMKVGDPADPTVMMGPLIRESQRSRVESYIRGGVDEGASVAFGGGRPDGLDRGFFLEPTLFAGADNEMRISQDEIFGPVGVVIPFDDEGEAVRIANHTRYGLAASVWHAHAGKAYEIGRRLRAGSVSVNGFPAPQSQGVFGGYKRSGIGRELGDHGLHEYLELKSITWPVG